MDSKQPKQTAVDHVPQQTIPEIGTAGNEQSDELALENLYREITGASESQAHRVYTLVIRDSRIPATT